MNHTGGNFARNTGNCALNSARAPRRAFCTEAWSERGLIGMISDTLSSEAKVSAMRRRNRSPFFRPLMAMNEVIATRISTASALGAGSSSGSSCRSAFINRTQITHAPGELCMFPSRKSMFDWIHMVNGEGV